MKATYYKYILSISILFSSLTLLGQDLNRKSLIEELKLKENTVFVINGIAFSRLVDSIRLDGELDKINRDLIVDLTSIKNEGQIGMANAYVIAIQYAVELPKEIIKKKFKEVKGQFNDEYFGFSQHINEEAKDPVLYIDNQKIHHTETKAILNKLNPSQIAYIKMYHQSREYRGENAKNGQVIIWTKNQLRKFSK